MPLRAYLRTLAQQSDVSRIHSLVDPDLEMAAICRREFSSPGGGHALLFEDVRDSPLRAAANLFGSEARMLAILRRPDSATFATSIRELLGARSGTSQERLRQICVAGSMTQTVAGNCTLSRLRLKDLPAVRSWPGEQGRYLTLALVQTVDPDEGHGNLGLYRAAMFPDGRLALNFTTGSGADWHLQRAAARGESLPVAVILGADPALTWAAAAPLPSGCCEYGFSRALVTPELALSRCDTQPLLVPAAAEVIIEGEIRYGARIAEGPFGNHTGQYVRRENCPLMTVTAIRHRDRPIVPFTVVGPPPSENINLGWINTILLREMLRVDYSLVRDFYMPAMTMFHGVGILALAGCSTNEVNDLIDDLWTSSPLKRSRLLILVDDDIDIRASATGWWRVVNQLRPDRVFHRDGRTIIDATGIDRTKLVAEDSATTLLLQSRRYDRVVAGAMDL
jgi:4-hydroxy-3-polyprenylbenzoate decarboxylase